MKRTFDKDLLLLTADRLKPMVKIWGGLSGWQKSLCQERILSSLADPDKVRTMISNLQPWEQNALSLVKQVGGSIHSSVLNLGILMTGYHPQRSHEWNENFAEPLEKKGLFLSLDTTYSYNSSGRRLYCDDRILEACVAYPIIEPFHLTLSDLQPDGLHLRHPNQVVLDIIGILHFVEEMKEIKLTKNGSLRVNDIKAMARSLAWEDDHIISEGFLFPSPAEAWLGAVLSSDLMMEKAEHVYVLRNPVSEITKRPTHELVRSMLMGFLSYAGWWETPPTRESLDSSVRGRQKGRLILTLALTALPVTEDGFYIFDDLLNAMFQRVGEDFALDRLISRPYIERHAMDDFRKLELEDWFARRKSEWLRQEAPWFASACTTWLHFLGIIELAIAKELVVGLRLTDLGKKIFHPDLVVNHPHAVREPVWIVQPDFEIIVYLDHILPAQLAFISNIAEREKSQAHTAHYRITKLSIYRALEIGKTAQTIIDELRNGAQATLPDNVLVEIKEWDGLRERVRIDGSAKLVEFETNEEASIYLENGNSGTLIGGRFVKVDSFKSLHGTMDHYFNYRQRPPMNLKVNEQGQILSLAYAHDLVADAFLDQWAERVSDNIWQLDRTHLEKVFRNGRKVTELIEFLKPRLIEALPELLQMALHSWVGEYSRPDLRNIILFRCQSPAVFKVLCNSPMFHPLIVGQSPPVYLFINPEKAEDFYNIMQWLGWDLPDEFAK